MKIDKNRLLNLTYSYDKFEQREAEYNKILSNHQKSLIVIHNHDGNQADRQRGHSLLESGYCRLPSIQKEFCNLIINRYFKGMAKNTLEKNNIDCESITNDKEVFDLFCNKKIIRPIQQYLGIFPSVQFIACWMSKGQEYPQRTNEMYWHMDHHGHKFVKAFYYMTDVKVGYGHHEYIAKTFHQGTFDNELNSNSELSHLKQSVDKKRLLRGKYKISDDSILPLKSKVINMTGPAGVALQKIQEDSTEDTITSNSSELFYSAFMFRSGMGRINQYLS